MYLLHFNRRSSGTAPSSPADIAVKYAQGRDHPRTNRLLPRARRVYPAILLVRHLRTGQQEAIVHPRPSLEVRSFAG